jgi:hypothetical protein
MAFAAFACRVDCALVLGAVPRITKGNAKPSKCPEFTASR